MLNILNGEIPMQKCTLAITPIIAPLTVTSTGIDYDLQTNCHTYMQGLTDLNTLLFVFVLTTFSDNSLLCVTVYVYFV